MVNENGENPPKNIAQTESSKKLHDGLKCAEWVGLVSTWA